MTPPAPAALPDLIVGLADTKFALGRRFSEWTNGAPTLEAAVAAAAMTQDELGHARSLYAALQNLPDSPEAYLREEKRGRRLSPPILDQPFGSWAGFVAASALVDRALTMIFQTACASRYDPLRQRAVKIVQEEKFHRLYGEAWLKQLAARGSRAQQTLQAAVLRLWQPTAEWLGSSYGAEIVASGTLPESAAALRARWSEEASGMLAGAGLKIHER